MDPISDLSFFILLLEKRSLSKTAGELGVTPPAITKRLNRLEERLGVKLINRTTRKLSLTSEGELYLEHARRIVDDLTEVEAMVTSNLSTPKGLLRVNAPLGFGRHYIAPLMSEFAKVYPDIDLQLELTDQPLNLPDNAFDLQIRFGEVPDSRLVARHIASNKRLLCASPKYLKTYGTPTTPTELANHKFIVIKQNESDFLTLRLKKGHKKESIKIDTKFITNDGDTALKWAMDGHGILLRAEWSLSKSVREGYLKIIMEDYETPPADIFAVYLHKKSKSAKLAAFLKHLEDSFLSFEMEKKERKKIW